MEKEVRLGVTPTQGRRGHEANAAAATVRREHQVLAENMKSESLLPRVQMMPGGARGPVSMKIWGTLQILGALGMFSLQTAMQLRLGRTVLVEKDNRPGCG